MHLQFMGIPIYPQTVHSCTLSSSACPISATPPYGTDIQIRTETCVLLRHMSLPIGLYRQWFPRNATIVHCTLQRGVSSQLDDKGLVRVEVVEISSLLWKSSIIAVIRYPLVVERVGFEPTVSTFREWRLYQFAHLSRWWLPLESN